MSDARPFKTQNDTLANDVLTAVAPFVEHAANCAGRGSETIACDCGYSKRIDILTEVIDRLRASPGEITHE